MPLFTMISMSLEAALDREYVGRMIIMGRDESGRNNVLVYAITGRSPSSQARQLVEEGEAVRVEVTDEAQLRQGNPALLVYPAIGRLEDTLFVSNGAQTDILYTTCDRMRRAKSRTDPMDVLFRAFNDQYVYLPGSVIDLTSYEPDAPTYTPRISGVMRADAAAMSIISRDISGKPAKYFFGMPLNDGLGKMISTYEGHNPSSGAIPSFTGTPIDVQLRGRFPPTVAENVFAALAPKPGKPDFRVAVATVFYDLEKRKMTMHIINRR